MPLETEVPMNIDQYKAKLVFGMTGRQLICALLAVVAAFATFLPLVLGLGISPSIASYAVFVTAAPFLMIGFIHPDGELFEAYALLYFRHRTAKNKLSYAAINNTDEKGGVSHGVKSAGKVRWCEEIENFAVPTEPQKARERANQRIAAAAKAH